MAEWLFVFNSAAVHMNQDHRSMGEVRQSFDHPGLSEPTRTNDQYFPPRRKRLSPFHVLDGQRNVPARVEASREFKRQICRLIAAVASQLSGRS